MTTKTAGSNVVYLESHPAWRAAQRRERDLADAIRRHPASQSRLEPVTSGNTAVHRLGSH
jgi:hypothetical protein